MPGHRSNATRIVLLTALAASILSACGEVTSPANPSTTGTSPATSGSTVTRSTAPPGSSPASMTPRGGSKAIPRLAGDTVSIAERYLQQAGLRLGHTLDKPNTRYQSGLVITTSPYAGDVVPYGSVVDLLVSAGSPGCQGSQCPYYGRYALMPDVIGQTIDQVTTTLALDGITVGPVAVEASSAPRGTVICTDPPASVYFPLTAPVKVGVSSGDPGSPPATLCEAASGPPTSAGPPPTSPSGSPPTSPSGPPTSPGTPSPSPSPPAQPSASP
jgi:beta-lactam-binding protein with PASTA domain